MLNIQLRDRKLKIIRLYGRAHERKDHPNPCHDLSKLGKRQTTLIEDVLQGRCLPEFQEDALHYKIRERNRDIEATRNSFCRLVNNYTIPSTKERNR